MVGAGGETTFEASDNGALDGWSSGFSGVPSVSEVVDAVAVIKHTGNGAPSTSDEVVEREELVSLPWSFPLMT